MPHEMASPFGESGVAGGDHDRDQVKWYWLPRPRMILRDEGRDRLGRRKKFCKNSVEFSLILPFFAHDAEL